MPPLSMAQAAPDSPGVITSPAGFIMPISVGW
jgi:hypothetical protein